MSVAGSARLVDVAHGAVAVADGPHPQAGGVDVAQLGALLEAAREGAHEHVDQLAPLRAADAAHDRQPVVERQRQVIATDL